MREIVTIKLLCNYEGSDVLTKENLEWLLANYYPQGSPYQILDIKRTYYKEESEKQEEREGGISFHFFGPFSLFKDEDDENE